MEFWGNLSLQNISSEIDNLFYTEEWKSIDDYEGIYEISTFGRVKSLKRVIISKIGKTKKIKECIRKQSVDANGYLVVGLYNKLFNKTKKVNILVCKAFLPNPNNYPQTNHLFGNKKDNFFNHLEWCTNQQNITHAIATGLTKQKADENPNSVVSNKTAIEIFNSKIARKRLAAIYHVNVSVINSIKNGRAYSSVTGKEYKKRYTKGDKVKILAIFNEAGKYENISIKYNVGYHMVLRIKTGKCYSSITGKVYQKVQKKLTRKEIIDIYQSKDLQRNISKRFKVGSNLISHIKNGRKYSNITGHVALSI